MVKLYLYVPDEGSLLPKYRDCTTSDDFELYIYIYIYIYIASFINICRFLNQLTKNTIYIYKYSVLFFLHICPLLIPLHNTAVLIKICRFRKGLRKFNNVD